MSFYVKDGVLCTGQPALSYRYCGCGKKRLTYLSAYEDAEQRMKRGERQLYCPACDCWVWPDHCDHPGRMNDKEHRQMMREAKAHARQYDTDAKRYKCAMRKAGA